MRKKLVIQLCYLLIILITLFTIPFLNISPLNSKWQEVIPTNNGRQWFNKKSVKIISNNILSVNSKFKPTNNRYLTTYQMSINCNTREFMDTIVDKHRILSAKWSTSNGDMLLDQVINESCKILTN